MAEAFPKKYYILESIFKCPEFNSLHSVLIYQSRSATIICRPQTSRLRAGEQAGAGQPLGRGRELQNVLCRQLIQVGAGSWQGRMLQTTILVQTAEP